MLELLEKLGMKKIAAIVAGALFILGIILVLMSHLSTPGFSPLYGQLSTRDSASLITLLTAHNIPFEAHNNGAEISVPMDKVLQARMLASQEGLPSSGTIVGYEIFDRSESLGVSSFVQDVNLIRALEGELGRSISSLDSIENARVHLVVPKRQVFSRENMIPTASVVLKMTNGRKLNKNEIEAISHLLATAVPGLKPEKITIIDTKGKSLTLGGKEEDDATSYNYSKEEFVIAYEHRIKDTVEHLIENYVGVGRVQAQVSADMEFDRIVTNSEVYDPSGQVPRSVLSKEEKEESQDKEPNDNITVASNLPGGSQTTILNNNSIQRTEETTNYEISKTIQNHIKETGTIKHLSIAVLIDGKYNLKDPANPKSDFVYEPRSQDELTKLRSLVATAVGLDEKRGDRLEVINMQFTLGASTIEPEEEWAWLKRDFHSVIQIIIVGVVVILIILLIIKPMVNRAFEISQASDDTADLQAALSGAELMNEITEKAGLAEIETEAIAPSQTIEQKVKPGTIKSINEIVKAHPSETASVIRLWLYGT